MRKICLFISMLSMTVSVLAQKNKVEYLSAELRNTGIYNISAVRTTDTATFVDVHVTFLPQWWSMFSKDNFIKASDDDQKFYPKGIIGAIFNKELWTPKSGDTLVTLVFDPLPKHIRKIDFGDAKKTFLYGVDLDGADHKSVKKTKEEKSGLAWVQGQLAKANNPKVLSSLKGKDFFKKDTVRIVGYIRGYDTRLGFSSGIIYNSNQLTREDFPATIRIYENGTFEVAYEANYPEVSYIAINNKIISFYAEPGHTIGMLLDWEDFLQEDRYRDGSYSRQNMKYLGDLAEFNTRFFALKLIGTNYKQLSNRQKIEAPTDFKQRVIAQWKAELSRIDTILSLDQADQKMADLVRAHVDVSFASHLFDYNFSRDAYSKQDTSNKILKIPLPDDYYNFVNLLDLNNQAYLATTNFAVFINRFEFSPLYPRMEASRSSDSFAFLDSVARERFLEIPLMVHIAKCRQIKSRISYVKDSKQIDNIVASAMKTTPSDFMKAESQRLKTEKIQKDAGYELPDTYGAQVFKKIIDKHKGKILMVDFWAEWCGPCRAGIESHFAEREKYKDNSDFSFLFITDGSTSDTFYKEYTVKQKMENSYKVRV